MHHFPFKKKNPLDLGVMQTVKGVFEDAVVFKVTKVI